MRNINAIKSIKIRVIDNYALLSFGADESTQHQNPGEHHPHFRSDIRWTEFVARNQKSNYQSNLYIKFRNSRDRSKLAFGRYPFKVLSIIPGVLKDYVVFPNLFGQMPRIHN